MFVRRSAHFAKLVHQRTNHAGYLFGKGPGRWSPGSIRASRAPGAQIPDRTRQSNRSFITVSLPRSIGFAALRAVRSTTTPVSFTHRFNEVFLRPSNLANRFNGFDSSR